MGLHCFWFICVAAAAAVACMSDAPHPIASSLFACACTGSSSGIGKAVALAFATQKSGSDRETTKICVMSRSKSKLQPVVEEIEKLGAVGYAVAGDLTKGSDCQSVVQEAVSLICCLNLASCTV